jgi:hypothetical protein
MRSKTLSFAFSVRLLARFDHVRRPPTEEVAMFVPAFAFAWWLVSLPMPSLSTAPVADPDARGATATHAAFRVGDAPATPGESNPAEPPVIETPIEGEWGGERVTVKIVTTTLVRIAQTLLDLPMGDERFYAVDGHRYVFVLERHYHPPGFLGAPNGWHKGVTVYELR